MFLKSNNRQSRKKNGRDRQILQYFTQIFGDGREFIKFMVIAGLALLLGSYFIVNHICRTGGDDLTDGKCKSDYPRNPYNVIECKDLENKWSCDNQGLGECAKDFYNFLDANSAFSEKIREQQLSEQIREIEEGNVTLEGNLSSEELKRKLLENLNIAFLKGPDFHRRELIVTTIKESEDDTSYTKELLFEDPYVGTFKAIWMLPKNSESVPTIVYRHGHGRGRDFYEGFNCANLVREGYSVIMPVSRCFTGGDSEHALAKEFLKKGFTTIGLRTYENALVLKAMRYYASKQNSFLKDKVALFGHSGGSAISNLSFRLDDFDAGVSDFKTNYICWNEDGKRFMDCMAPKVWKLHDAINDFASSKTPLLEIPYKDPTPMTWKTHPETYDFLKSNLLDK